MWKDFFMQKYWSNQIMDYLICVILFLLSFLILRIFETVILKKLRSWAEKSKTSLENIFVKIFKDTALPLAYIGAFYMSINTLKLNQQIIKFIDFAAMAVLTVFTTRFIIILITFGLTQYWKSKGKDLQLEGSLRGILRVLKIVIWGMALVFFLDNMGFKISAVIAGLGVGGVAVALAAQAVLGDLFSYFAILFDRPFEIGDFIIVGDYMGVVQQIGIKTTRITSLGGEQIIFSNTDLTNSRVRNYRRMEKRRVVFKLGVIYQTTTEKLKEIPAIIQRIIKNVDETVFDRAHFFAYGDFSLIYEVVYYVLGSDFNKYMDVQQKINLAINEEFKNRAIEFAYPSQTVYIKKPD